MAENFQNTVMSGIDSTEMKIRKIKSARDLTNDERARLNEIEEHFNYYEGYQWEDIAESEDSPQVTVNYCRLFVDKFVAFEMGKGFNITIPKYLEGIEVTVNDPKIIIDEDEDKDGFIEENELDDTTITDSAGANRPSYKVRQKYMDEFLEEVWQGNDKDLLITEIGQMKSITGDAWVHPTFVSAEELALRDPFGEYPNGKIVISVLPSQYCFPTMSNHDKDILESMLVMYPIRKEVPTGMLLRDTKTETVLYKQYWTPTTITVYEGEDMISREQNPYGFLPFVHIKNFPEAGKTFGISDITDVIPLNTEFNIKNSDVSEIIDYHAAPITCIFGAKIGNLEKGANKVWGGLPKDARVENLQMQGDLVASQQYITHLKTSMCEVGNISENMLGGVSHISNTSGVALHYMNLPLEERTNVKRLCTSKGLVNVNKMIIHIAYLYGMLRLPENLSMRDFLVNTVSMPDTLPRDELVELQKIQTEMQLHLECRHGALERLGRDDIHGRLAEIDREAMEHPEIFNPDLQKEMFNNEISEVNSGMTNGETPQELVRKEITGQNGGGEV